MQTKDQGLLTALFWPVVALGTAGVVAFALIVASSLGPTFYNPLDDAPPLPFTVAEVEADCMSAFGGRYSAAAKAPGLLNRRTAPARVEGGWLYVTWVSFEDSGQRLQVGCAFTDEGEVHVSVQE